MYKNTATVKTIAVKCMLYLKVILYTTRNTINIYMHSYLFLQNNLK